MGAIGRHTVNTSERLASLRELMRKPEFDVKTIVVPSEDERECGAKGFSWCHCLLTLSNGADFSEYPAEADKRRSFISGFNGSAGDPRT